MILKKPRLLCASFVCFFDSSSNRVYCDNATKVMCVANVIFRQERLTVQLLSMHFFMTAHLQASTSLSTRCFCESILFVHLKALRGDELHLVRTVGMVRLEEIFFETLSKKCH